MIIYTILFALQLFLTKYFWVSNMPFFLLIRNALQLLKMEGIDEVTCNVSAVKISTVAPQYVHASLGEYL